VPLSSTDDCPNTAELPSLLMTSTHAPVSSLPLAEKPTPLPLPVEAFRLVEAEQSIQSDALDVPAPTAELPLLANVVMSVELEQ
jgi:hypothetical protein